MGSFFNLDNKLFQSVNKAVDCVTLSMLWLLCCIPVVTVGAASTAVYYTINKVIRHGRGYLWSEYWHAFRVNFKQATLAWLIVLATLAIMAIDSAFMRQLAESGQSTGILSIVFLVLFFLVLVWAGYVFSYLARFENSLWQTLKNSAFMAIVHLPWTLLVLVLVVVSCLAVYVIFPLILVVPAVYAMLLNQILEKIFKKYMSPEDLAEEEERNREYYN